TPLTGFSLKTCKAAYCIPKRDLLETFCVKFLEKLSWSALSLTAWYMVSDFKITKAKTNALAVLSPNAVIFRYRSSCKRISTKQINCNPITTKAARALENNIRITTTNEGANFIHFFSVKM